MNGEKYVRGKHNICVGALPGRVKPCLYRYVSEGEIEVLASFASYEAAGIAMAALRGLMNVKEPSV